MQSNMLGQTIGRSGGRFFLLQTTIGLHVPEETLMSYASGHLPENALRDVEEHMLMCESCQSALETIDDHMRAGAEAAREIREQSKKRKKARAWSLVFSGRSAVWAVVLAAAVILAVPAARRKGPVAQNPPIEISLTAERGTAQARVPHTESSHLTLKIDSSELPNLPVYRLQLVDAAGKDIWSGSAPNIDGQIRAGIPQALGYGQYWVRLFTPDSHQLREFGLTVE